MPALEEHELSNNEMTLEYVATTDKYTFLFEEEDNKDTFVFEDIDKSIQERSAM